MPVSKIRVLIAEDHAIVREGLALLLERSDAVEVIAQAQNGEEAVALYSLHLPDVILMDLNMPVMDGVAAIAAIKSKHPAANILVLTTYDGDETIYQGLQAGARGYLLKDTPVPQLLEAIRVIHSGQTYLPSMVAAKLAERIRYHPLTAREQEVLQLVVKGKSNHEIADALYIVEGTVKSHVNSILSKLGVSDRTQAVTTALRRGIVQLD